MRIARFKNIELNFEIICDWREEAHGGDYIRISEYIDVEFVEKNREEVVKREIDHIDKQIQTIRSAAQIKTNDLEQRKAELLALPDLGDKE